VWRRRSRLRLWRRGDQPMGRLPVAWSGRRVHRGTLQLEVVKGISFLEQMNLVNQHFSTPSRLTVPANYESNN
jgi:hypothetical protein